MKKQINPTIKAHLIRSAFYVLLLRCLRDSIRAGAAKHNQAKRRQTRFIWLRNGDIVASSSQSPIQYPQTGRASGAAALEGHNRHSIQSRPAKWGVEATSEGHHPPRRDGALPLRSHRRDRYLCSGSGRHRQSHRRRRDVHQPAFLGQPIWPDLHGCHRRVERSPDFRNTLQRLWHHLLAVR